MISLRYLAGFVDGEGSITLARRKREWGTVEYCSRVSIANTNRRILEGIQQEYGGTLSDYCFRDPRWKPGHALIWTNAAAERLIERLQPELRVKAKQVQALLQFRDYRNTCSRRRSDSGRLLSLDAMDLEVREQIYWILRALNAKGTESQIPGSARETAASLEVSLPDRVSSEYLAGFLDAEAAFMITRSRAKRCLNPSYRARISAVNTNAKVISDIQRDFGGILVDQAARDSKWRACRGVVWTGRMIKPLLSTVGPLLRLKAEQAKGLLEFDKHMEDTVRVTSRPKPLSDYEVAFRETCYQKVKELNARGVSGTASESLAIEDAPALGT